MASYCIRRTTNLSQRTPNKSIIWSAKTISNYFHLISDRLLTKISQMDSCVSSHCFRALWFIINLVGRVSQKLAIIGLELTTAAFVVCTVVTCFCWAHKPADLTVSEVIQTKTPTSEILHLAAQNGKYSYRQTSLDFISRKEWPWSLYWSNWLNICRHLGFKFVQVAKPIDGFANTSTTETKGWRLALFYATTTIYKSKRQTVAIR